MFRLDRNSKGHTFTDAPNQHWYHRREGLAVTGAPRLEADSVDIFTVEVAAGAFRPVAGESVLLDCARTFLALAAVGFIKLAPGARRAAAAVLGTVLLPGRLAVVGLADGVEAAATTEVRRDPFREVLALLVTELRDALELDRLRFSLELVARPLVVLGLVLVMLLRTPLRRLLVELEFCVEVADGRLDLLMVGVDLRVDLGDSVLLPSVVLLREREELLMLLLLLPFILDMGFLSVRPENAVLLFRGFTTPLLMFSSLFFIKFLVISFERSLILLKVPLGLSGGRLVAREEMFLLARLEVEPRVSRLGRELLRLVRLPALPPLANRSNTLLSALAGGSRVGRDRRSIIELLRLVSGFLRSRRE